MPQRQVKFEGRTYTVPNDASDDEVFSFLDSQSKPTPPPGAATPRAGVGQRGMAPPPSPFQATSEQAFRQGMGQRQQQLGIQAPSSATAFTPEGGWGDLGRTALRTVGAGALAAVPEAALPAIGMGALGGATGDALYQIIQHITGGQDAPQTSGEVARGLVGGGLEGAMQEAGGQAISKGVPKLLRSSAGRTIRQVLNPSTLADKAAVKEMAPKFMSEMPLAASPESLLSKFETGMNSAGTAVDNAYAQIPGNVRFRTTAINNGLTQARSKLYNKASGKLVPGMEGKDAAYSELIDWFNQHPRMTADDLRSNKQLWDEVVNWGRKPGASRPDAEGVYKEGADAIRKLIGNVYPHINDANQAYDMWATAHGLMKEAETKAGGKAATALRWRDLMPILGGQLLGGPHGAEAGLALSAAEKLAETTAWRTASVRAKSAAIRALTMGYPAEYATRVLAGTAAAPLANMMIPAHAPTAPPPGAPPF